jgi:hypothetical protein
MMKRLFLIGALTLAAGLLQAQVRLYVTLGGKRVGQAVASQKILPDGSKLVQLSMNLAGPGGSTVTLRQESTYSPKGAPIRKFHESLKSSPRERRQVTVTFGKGGAQVVEEVGGKRNLTNVPLVASAPIEANSEFWFIRDKPKPGATDKYYHFNVSKMEWELLTTTYGGVKTILIGGKKVKAHEVKSSQGVAYVDDKGLPYQLQLGQIKLERVPD